MIIPFKTAPTEKFFWLNKPEFTLNDNSISIETENSTDFWQRTHYGFARDNGHALLTSVTEGFDMTVRTEYNYASRYDQCGLLVRVDGLNWIKVSSEWEDENLSRLGSVVTNLGYSDWATTDVAGSVHETWYRVECRENDFSLYSSMDGHTWVQMRIAHLHSRQRPLNIGIYACSPKTGGFRAVFSDFSIAKV